MSYFPNPGTFNCIDQAFAFQSHHDRTPGRLPPRRSTAVPCHALYPPTTTPGPGRIARLTLESHSASTITECTCPSMQPDALPTLRRCFTCLIFRRHMCSLPLACARSLPKSRAHQSAQMTPCAPAACAPISSDVVSQNINQVLCVYAVARRARRGEFM